MKDNNTEFDRLRNYIIQANEAGQLQYKDDRFISPESNQMNQIMKIIDLKLDAHEQKIKELLNGYFLDKKPADDLKEEIEMLKRVILRNDLFD